MQRDDDVHGLTEADRTSQTRFGPRPVPKGHKTASPYPYRPMRSSKIPPSAPMAPDGRRPWPRPSLTARIVVWGGLAAATAGAAAGAVLLGRKAAQVLGGDRPAPRRADPSTRRDPATLAPLFAELDDAERDEIRRLARQRARHDLDRDLARERGRPEAEARSPGLVEEVTQTAAELSGSLHSVAAAVDHAFGSFRNVASQASAILAEFGAVADQVRGDLRTSSGERDDNSEAGRGAGRPCSATQPRRATPHD